MPLTRGFVTPPKDRSRCSPCPRGFIACAYRKGRAVGHVRFGRELGVGIISEGDASGRIGHGRQPSLAVGSLVVDVSDVHVGGEVRKSYTSTRMPV